jgi:hypothetical protein
MTDFLHDPLVQSILLAIAAVVVLGLFGWLKLRRDERVVADFLKSSGVETRRSFRTSDIAEATNLHEERVRVICKKSPRIGQKHDEEDSWKLHD